LSCTFGVFVWYPTLISTSGISMLLDSVGVGAWVITGLGIPGFSECKAFFYSSETTFVLWVFSINFWGEGESIEFVDSYRFIGLLSIKSPIAEAETFLVELYLSEALLGDSFTFIERPLYLLLGCFCCFFLGLDYKETAPAVVPPFYDAVCYCCDKNLLKFVWELLSAFWCGLPLYKFIIGLKRRTTFTIQSNFHQLVSPWYFNL
jgi:hypothetical protein